MEEAPPEKDWRNLVLTTYAAPPLGAAPSGVIFGSLVSLSATEALHFGGADEFRPFSEAHIYNFNTGWCPIEEESVLKPAARYAHAAVVLRREMLLFGGLRCVQQELDAGSASFDPPLPLPPDSSGRQRMWCHRGEVSNDTFVLKLDHYEWERLADMPSGRAFHSACVVGDFVLLFGGCSDSSLEQNENTLWLFDTVNRCWTPCEQTGDIPAPRHGHEICYANEFLYLFGGELGRQSEGGAEVYRLNVSSLLGSIPNEGISLEWETVKMHSRSKASMRRHFAMQLINNRLLCYGGLTCNAMSDVYAFDLESRRWLRPLQDGVIDIAGHASCLLGTKMMLFGGCRAHPIDSATREVLNALSGGNDGILAGPARLLRHVQFTTLLKLRKEMVKDGSKGKLVVLGDAAVGKSCLLERFADDVYTEAHPATVGFDFFSVTTMVRGKVVSLQLWDTAGQERFDGLTGNYYRNADGFVFVYDSTRRSTFNHIERWITRVKDHHSFSPNCLKLIIGNKQDMVDELQVTNEEGKQLADTLGGIYLGTSAKTGDGVDLAFLIAAAQLALYRAREPAKKAVEFRLETAPESETTALATLGRLCSSC